MAWTTGLFLLLALLIITRVDWRDYRESAYYQDTMASLEALDFESEHSDDFWIAGWAKANHTPEEPTPLVGYKPRGKYEFVQDSSHVRALVLGNGSQRIAFLGYELLLVHPHLADQIREAVKAKDLPIDLLYFTATHTHSGMGGYMPGLAGRLVFGGLDQAIMDDLKVKTLAALEAALASQDTVKLSYNRIKGADFVENRFIPDGPIDPYLRQLKLEKTTGETGVFVSFSAHSTCLSSKFMGLSGDYPHYLMQQLEEESDFALFASGTVGSHRPVRDGNDVLATQQYAHRLDSLIKVNVEIEKQISGNNFSFQKVPISLRSPHIRISENWRLRPWIFEWLFGSMNAHFDVVRLGDLLLISSSGELSGVFYEQWEAIAQSQGLELMITTFNGNYIGYITPDEFYNYRFHEVREMNWFGPYNGAYFDELIKAMILKASN